LAKEQESALAWESDSVWAPELELASVQELALVWELGES
jgi:hypothetical protein